MPPKEDAFLARLRKLCLALPDTSEVTAWGHPNFKRGKKTFAVFEKYKGEWCVAFQTPLELQQTLVEDPRYYISPYIGHKGWVSLKIEPRVNWGELSALVRQSYELNAPPARKR